MGILARVFGRRENISPSLNTDEALTAGTGVYMDPLVQNNRLYYHDVRARFFVSKQDPVASTLCVHLAERLTMKPFIIYDSQYGSEIQPEIMMAFEAVDGMEMAREIIENLIRDGYNLWDPYTTNDGGFGWFNYGAFECRPNFWSRATEGFNSFDPNQIMVYKVWYVPQDVDHRWGGTGNFQAVQKTYSADQIFHFTRGKWNYGLGESILKSCWDPITKLRIASNADNFIRDIRGQILVPQNWKPDKKRKFVDTVNEWSSHRWLIINAVQNQMTQEPTGLPSVGFRALGEDATPKGTYGKSTTGETLMDPEWGRLFASSRLTKMWWIGAEAGALTGSEVNMTQDIIEEIQHFTIIEPVIKKVFAIMADWGIIPPLPETYSIKYWREHEILIAQQQAMEQQLVTSEIESEQNAGAEIDGKTKNVSFSTEADIDREIQRTITELDLLEQSMDLLGHEHGERIPKAQDITAAIIALEREWIRYSKIIDSLYNLKRDRFNMALEVWSHRENAPPNQWVGVGATSSGLRRVKYVPGKPGPGGVAESMLAQFSGGATYRIQDPERLDAEEAVDEITGGGSVGKAYWSLIRAGPGGTTSPAPKGAPKTGNPQHFAYAGRAHYTDYQLIGGGAARAIKPKKITAPKQAKIGAISPMAEKTEEVAAKITKIVEKKTPEIKATLKIAGMRKDFFDAVSKTKLKVGNIETLSRKKFREKAEGYINHSFGDHTIDKIKKLMIASQADVIRHNSVHAGEPMNFDIPLFYPNSRGGIDVEYACKADWKKYVVGRHNIKIGHGDEHIVGEGWYDWDDKTDLPTITTDLDRNIIIDYMDENNLEKEFPILYNKIITGAPIPISTEYGATIEVVNGKAFQRKFKDFGLALVNQGNCPDDLCSLIEVK